MFSLAAGALCAFIGGLPRMPSGQDSDCERSTAAGFEQHLVKPISIEQLVALSAARGL